METLLKELSDKIEVNLTEEQISKFITYKELLKDWNQKINLTAITEDREIVLKHFVDSLTVLKYIPQNANIIDVGTGAGFPGIPTKIAREDVSVTLIDSLNKRINFLNDVIEISQFSKKISLIEFYIIGVNKEIYLKTQALKNNGRF